MPAPLSPRLTPQASWFAPPGRRRHRRRRRRVWKKLRSYVMPAIVAVLFVCTGAVTFKVMYLDKRKRPKPPPTGDAAPNLALLDAEMYGYKTAFVESRAGQINLYGKEMISDSVLDPRLAVLTYSDRLTPEIRAALHRTNFSFGSPSAALAGSPGEETVRDPRQILRSYARRTPLSPPRPSTSTNLRVVAESDPYLMVAKLEPERLSKPPPLPPPPPKTVASTSPPRPSPTAGRSGAPLLPLRQTTTSLSGAVPFRGEPSPQAMLQTATRLYQAGNMSGAEEICRKLIEEGPATPALHNLHGEVLARMGRWNEAIPQFEKAIAAEPTNAEYHNNLGLVLSQIQRDAEGEKHLSEAARLDPLNSVIKMNLVWHYRKVGRYAEALRLLDLLLALDPNNVAAKNKRIQTLLDLKEYGKVEDAIQKQLAANPRDAQAMMMMAVLFSRQGEVEQAIEWLKKAEPITGRPGLLRVLEKVSDFDEIKETSSFQSYLASLRGTG